MFTESGDPFVLIDVLLRHNLPFVVIGGYAVNYHGYLRATEDVDILFQRTPESEGLLLAALTELGAYWIGSEIDPTTGIERIYPISGDYIRRTHLMMLGTHYGFLDVFDYVPGITSVSVQQVIDSADRSQGRPFVSLKWLLRMKAASGRPQDRRDLEYLSDSSSD